jgi:glyoxylase I family protein
MANPIIQLQGLDHVVIRAHDSKRLIRFYYDILGCKIERQPDSNIRLTQLRAGNSQIDILTSGEKLSQKKGALPGSEAHNI